MRAVGPIVPPGPVGSINAIFTMNADGTQLTQTTQSPKGREDFQPVWSPNGKEIAFVRSNTSAPSNESAIEVMNADGSNLRRLTPLKFDAGDPHWSPDGKRILFNTYAVPLGGQRPVPGRSANLYTMRPDGTHRVALTHYAGGTLQALADDWSPDGSRILFNRVAYSGTSTSVGGVGRFYIMNLRTKHTRRLTERRTHSYNRAAWGRRPS